MTNDKYLPAKAGEIHKHRVRMPYGLAIEAMQTILNLANDTITDPAYAIAASMALDALKREAADNDPLTIEELRGMDGEPVWITHKDGSGGRWGIVNICPLGICADIEDGAAYWFEDYIDTLAYRRKPDGGAK